MGLVKNPWQLTKQKIQEITENNIGQLMLFPKALLRKLLAFWHCWALATKFVQETASVYIYIYMYIYIYIYTYVRFEQMSANKNNKLS